VAENDGLRHRPVHHPRIRVRGQAELEGNRTLLAQESAIHGNGAPYTLNVNLGVLPNNRRPHWQYLDPGEDSADNLDEANFCGQGKKRFISHEKTT